MKETIVFFLTVSAFAVSRLKQEAPEIVDGPIKVKTNYEIGDIDSELYIETLKWWHQEITAQGVPGMLTCTFGFMDYSTVQQQLLFANWEALNQYALLVPVRDFEREIHPDYVKDPNHEAYKEMIDQIVTYTEIYGGTDENKEALYRTAFNEPIFVKDEKVDPLTEGAYSVDPINGWLNERPLKSDLRKLSEAAEKYCTAKNGEGLTKGTKLTPYYESMGPLEITQTFRVKKGQWDTVEKHFRNLELYFRAASLQDKGMISWEHNQDPLTQRYVITSYFKNRKSYDLFMKLQNDYPFVDDTVAVQNGTQLLHTRYVASSWDVFCNFTIAPKKTIYLGKPIFAREPQFGIVEKVKPRPPNYLLLAPILDFAALGLNVMSNTGTDWMIALGVEGFAGLVGLISWAMARKFKSSKVVTGLHILSELGVFYLIRKAEKSARNTKNGATIVSFFNAGMSLMLSLHFNHEGDEHLIEI